MNNNQLWRAVLYIFLLTVAFTSSTFLKCQTPVEREFEEFNLFSISGSPGASVRAIEEDTLNNLVYYGGRFAAVGLDYQGHALFNTAHDSVFRSFPNLDEFDDLISTYVATNTGWYIGGRFNSIQGEEIKYLAFIDSFGEPHPTPYNLNGLVDIIHIEDSIMVLTGDFTSINGSVCGGLAVINLNTEEVIENIPSVNPVIFGSPNSQGSEIDDVDIVGTEVFVTGGFSMAGEISWDGAKIDLETGQLLPINSGNQIDCAESDGSGGWFFGGFFQQLGDSARTNLAHVDSTGKVSDFRFDCDGRVKDLVFINDTLYVAGEFEHINGIQRKAIAAIDYNQRSLTNLYGNFFGSIDQIDVNADSLCVSGQFSIRDSYLVELSTLNDLQKTPHNINGEVFEIIPDGFGGWYWFGDFTEVDSQPRNKAAHFDQSGNLSHWQIPLGLEIIELYDALLTDSELIFLAGEFEGLQFFGTTGNLIAISPINGDVIQIGQDFSGDINCLTANQNFLFIGGDYIVESFDENTTFYLSRLDINNFDLEFMNNQPFGEVTALVFSENEIFVSGDFTQLEDGASQEYFTSYDWETLDPVLLDIDFEDQITSMVIDGNRLYALGDFNEVNGADRNGLAAIDLNSLSLTTWNPDIHSVYDESEIFALGDHIYISRVRVQDPSQRFLRRFDPDFGFLDESWLPRFFSTGPVGFDDQEIYAAMPELDQNALGGISSLTKRGQASKWQPGNFYEFDFMKFHDDFLYCITKGNLDTDTLLRFGPDGTRDSWGTYVEGDIFTMDFYGESVYLGGNFSLEEAEHPNLVQYSIPGDEVVAFNLYSDDTTNNFVTALTIQDDFLYSASYNLNEFGSNITRFDLTNNTITDWQGPTTLGISLVYVLSLSGQSLYADFAWFGGEFRRRMMSFDWQTGELSDFQSTASFIGNFGYDRIWAKEDTVAYLGSLGTLEVATADSGQIIWSIDQFDDHHLIGDSIIVSGDFTEIEGQARFGLAALKLSDGSLLNWNPLSEGTNLTDFYVLNNFLVLRSVFSEIFLPNDNTGYMYAHVNLSNGTVSPGMPVPLNLSILPEPMYRLYSNQYGSIIVGDFGAVDTQERRNLLSRNTETGDLTEWSPSVGSGSSWVDQMVLHGDSIYIAGNFNTVNGESRFDFASVNRFSGELSAWTPTQQQSPYIGKVGNSLLFSSQDIGAYYGQPENKTLLIDLETFEPEPFGIDVKITGHAFKGDTIFIAGNFESVNSVPRTRLAALRISTSEVLDWDPQGEYLPADFEPIMQNNDSLLFVRGWFDNPDGSASDGIIRFDLAAEDWDSWTLFDPSPGFGDILLKDTTLYANDHYSGASLALISINDGSFVDYNLKEQTIGTLSFDGELLFHGSSIYEMQDCEIALSCTDQDYALPTDGPLQLNAENLIEFISSPCGDNYEFELSSQILDCNNLGFNSIEVTVTLPSGISATCVSTVEIIDLEAPNIDCTDLQLTLGENQGVALNPSDIIVGNYTACEAVDFELSGQTFFDCDDVGQSFEIEAMVMDISGNLATCTSTVEIIAVDSDGDGIDNGCDLCFGDNASGDSDGDGICSDAEIVGCLDPGAANFNPFATDPGLCSYLPDEPPYELTEEFYEEEGGELGGTPTDLVIGSEITPEWKLTAFPNPVQGDVINVHLQNLGLNEPKVEFKLIDVNSRVVLAKSYSKLANPSSAILQLELDAELSHGIYLLRVEINGQIKSVKIVK